MAGSGILPGDRGCAFPILWYGPTLFVHTTAR